MEVQGRQGYLPSAKEELFPYVPEAPVDSWKAREIVLEIIKYFMRKHYVTDIVRVRHRANNGTISFSLISGNVALRVSSAQDSAELIIELLAKRGSVIDPVGRKSDVLDTIKIRVEPDFLLERWNRRRAKSMMSRLWEHVMWSEGLRLGEMYCYMGWTAFRLIVIDFFTLGCEDEED